MSFTLSGSIQKPKRSPPKQSDVARYGSTNEDPYPIPSGESPEFYASFCCDIAIQTEQFFEESFLPMLHRIDRMKRKLADPANADRPGRDKAAEKASQLERGIVLDIRDLIRDEARADRIWQAMEPADRAAYGVAGWWRTPAETERLIGRMWRGIASQFTFPVGWQIPQVVVRGMPVVLVRDVREAGLIGWTPNPRPELFDDEENTVDTAVLRQIADERGNPR